MHSTSMGPLEPPGQESTPGHVIPAGKEHVCPGVGSSGHEEEHPPQLGAAHSHSPSLHVQETAKESPHPQVNAAGHV
jgi:hypothetical protein